MCKNKQFDVWYKDKQDSKVNVQSYQVKIDMNGCIKNNFEELNLVYWVKSTYPLLFNQMVGCFTYLYRPLSVFKIQTIFYYNKYIVLRLDKKISVFI